MSPGKSTLLSMWLAFPATAADIALDIGHYTEQPGVTSASGVKELELNRLLAHDVAEQIKAAGVSYQFIGDDGKMNALAERTAAAQDARLFLSIHHDSVLPEWMPRAREFSGYSLFVSRKNAKTEVSLACARIIGAKLLAAGYTPSRYHAMPVVGENRPFADERLGIHYFDDLVVLKTAQQPAVLIEAGVIVNPQDEQKVTGTEGRRRLAHALASGAKGCLRMLNSK